MFVRQKCLCIALIIFAAVLFGKFNVILLVYCDDDRFHIDINCLGNKIRPFAVGLKNWLFSASQGGANASASLFGLIETAKAKGMNEYAYLKHIFTELPKAQTVEDCEQLLPWNVDPEVLNQMMCGPSLS